MYYFVITVECHTGFALLSLPQLMSVVSFERYQKELLDVQNPGVLAVPLGQDQQCYSTRTARSSGRYSTEYIFYLILITLIIQAPDISIEQMHCVEAPV